MCTYLQFKTNQKTFREETEFIFENREVFNKESLSPKQRLLAYDYYSNSVKNKPFFYLNSNYNINMIPIENGMAINKTFADLEEITAYISKNDVELIEMYSLNSFEDLLRFEMLKVIETNTVITKCENGNTCAEVGSYKKYNQKAKDDPIFSAYNKAYKRNNSRTRNKKMTNEEFLLWSEEARKKRDDCFNDSLSLEDFNAWLGNVKMILRENNKQ